MKQPKPTFHELEFSGGAAFWTQGDASTRRTFLMPMTNPSEFLAFGVLRPSSTVLFVARGTVREHLGGFIAQMVREQASVELYARPPLPREILKEYDPDLPYDSQVPTDPEPIGPKGADRAGFDGGLKP